MMDLQRAHEVTELRRNQLMQEADHWRLGRAAAAGVPVRRFSLLRLPGVAFAQQAGHQLIRAGWRLAGTPSGARVARAGVSESELSVADAPC
jgi:hypothetical protein